MAQGMHGQTTAIGCKFAPQLGRGEIAASVDRSWKGFNTPHKYQLCESYRLTPPLVNLLPAVYVVACDVLT